MQVTGASDAVRMDRHYRYQRYIYDATRSRYLVGRRRLIRDLDLGPSETVLEIGCGTAWNLARVASAYPEARCFGLDVSNAMLEVARRSLDRRGVADRVTLRQGDATAFDPGDLFGIDRFDRVFFSYALSMIPGWERALDLAAGHIAPGGALMIVDFGQCDRLPVAFREAFFAFLKHYTVIPRADFDAVTARAAAAHGLKRTYTTLGRGYADYAILTAPR